MIYISDKEFTKPDFAKSAILTGEYEHCSFINCDLSSQDLSNCKFIDCIFSGSNLSLSTIKNCAFQNVQFLDTKLSGLQFDTCNLFGLSFSFVGCIIQHATFFELKMGKTLFKQSDLTGSDFTGTDLTDATFDECNLSQTIFERTVLTNADFKSAFNFMINPAINKLNKTKFSMEGLPGLLSQYNIIIE